jgi:Protein of unknown function (DUF1573)
VAVLLVRFGPAFEIWWEFSAVRALGWTFGVFAGIVILGAVIWFARYSPWAEKYPNPLETRVVVSEPVASRRKKELQQKEREKAQKPPADEPRFEHPKVADKPPFPKAVVAERSFNLGNLDVGEERKHTFRIENKGDAPLVLVSESGMQDRGQWRREIPPGSSTELELGLRSLESSPTFSKRTKVWTNDPKSPEIQFELSGRVLADFRVEPSDEWRVRIMGNEDGKITGKIGSEQEESFRIVSVETDSRLVTVEYRPLNADELHEARLKSGYALNVTVSKDIPEGVFHTDLKIKTTLKKGETINVGLTALQLR